MHPVGYGESQPRNKCTDGVECTEDEHARNRRTEVKMITAMQGSSVVYIDGKMIGASTAPNSEAAQANTKPAATENPVPVKPPKPTNVNTAPAKTKTKPATAAGDDASSPAPVVESLDNKTKPDNKADNKYENGEKDAYYVISGSFLMETRAIAQVDKLKKAGYDDTQIVRFGGSPFFSVSLGKFPSRNDAEVLKHKLDKEHIDAFVRVGM
jgi:cell division septation protein DedD